MILYNVTVSVEKNISEQWIKWMKTEHIPEVMATRCFKDYKLLHLETETPDNPGITYCIQYWCKSKAELNNYLEKHAAGLRAAHQKAFPNKFVAFRTILNEI